MNIPNTMARKAISRRGSMLSSMRDSSISGVPRPSLTVAAVAMAGP